MPRLAPQVAQSRFELDDLAELLRTHLRPARLPALGLAGRAAPVSD